MITVLQTRLLRLRAAQTLWHKVVMKDSIEIQQRPTHKDLEFKNLLG